MENQHRKISGYRELNQKEIDLMNKVKALGPEIEAVMNEVSIHIANQATAAQNDPALSQRLENATPGRFLALANTNLQTGLMYATRAVAQPEFY